MFFLQTNVVDGICGILLGALLQHGLWVALSLFLP
jgi:hypothetical protein